jgi:transcriptional regulator with XRE-family HTH domain
VNLASPRQHAGLAAPAAGGEELIGHRVRRLRADRGLSARVVAARAGITPAYLSRLENDKVSPTVSTLTRVLQAIGVSVGQLFTSDAGPVVRAGERRRVDSRGVADYLVTPEDAQRLRVLETVIEPGAGSGEQSYHHSGDEECILVLEGGLRVWLDERLYELNAGDSITFACRRPHRWVNGTRTTARVIWVITPAGGY